MHRRELLRLLGTHRPVDSVEEESCRRIVDFVSAHPSCFQRALEHGHVTGSAWLLDRDGSRALLTFHRKLGRWLQPGGHADGDCDILAVALREAREESGIDGIEPASLEIFDVDVHRIPARPSEPEHDHYDVRFLFRVTGDNAFRVSEESVSLRWFSMKELAEIETDESVRRMARKWQTWSRVDRP